MKRAASRSGKPLPQQNLPRHLSLVQPLRFLPRNTMRTNWHTCRMSSLAAPTSPTVMRTGEVRASLTRRSTFCGMVALNSRVWRLGRTCPIMLRTCSQRAGEERRTTPWLVALVRVHLWREAAPLQTASRLSKGLSDRRKDHAGRLKPAAQAEDSTARQS